MVRDQELIPVDAILRDGVGNIDNSFITGEPIPIHKQVGELVKAGGRQRGPAIELEVVKPFSESHLKQLWEEHSGSGKHGRPAMPRLIDTVARRFTFAVLLIALGAGLYWWGRDPGQVWQVVTAVLIVACPCALALSMPFAYGHTMRALGRKGIFLRDTEVVERMALVDTVVFDKTGTLTAREAYEIQFVGDPLSARESTYVRTLARNSTHPLSAAIYAGTKSTIGAVSDVSETTGAGIAGTVDGIPVRIGSRTFTGAEAFERSVGTAEVHVNIGGVHRGRFALRKRTRDGMRSTIAHTRELAGTWLLTGDPTVDPEVADMFSGDAAVSGCSPVEKAAFVVARQAEGARVMMVGDGLNDAGALQQSDVGVTVSESSAALTPASDAIIDAKSIVRLPGALLLARRARRIVFASLGISLLYNVVGVSVAISGHLTPLVAAILMPLSSVTVVGFVSLSVHLVARSVFNIFDADKSHVTP